jgi:hypothetical protein
LIEQSICGQIHSLKFNEVAPFQVLIENRGRH